jgi:glutathione synthase/RimK-type ligase-like ATP-grasp enzyme
MNLLVTNTQEEQAYLILRSLRHKADRIIITVPEGSLFSRWSGISAWSRYVHRRYAVPDCTDGWRAGRLEGDNTADEERYIRRIEEICALEKIDVIFPSYDAEVQVFSRNKSRLAALGVTAVVPEYAALTRMLDKQLTLEGARRVGFPVPETFAPASEEELLEAASRLRPPWVLKPRLNAHGANIFLVHDLAGLKTAFARLAALQSRPLLQEYVPVQTKRNYYLVVSPDGDIVTLHSPSISRHRTIGVRTPCAVAETTSELPLLVEVRALVKELGVWGGMTLQTVISSTDGLPRLMEINPRFGHNLWYRTELGIAEPEVYLKLAQGAPLPQISTWPTGVLLLDPFWDLFHLCLLCLDGSKTWLCRTFGLRPPVLGSQGPGSVTKLLRSLRSEYFGGKRRVTNPLNRGYFSDPMVPLVRMSRTILFEFQRRWKVARKAGAGVRQSPGRP